MMGRIVIQSGIDNSQLDRGLKQVEDATKRTGVAAGGNLSAMQKSFQKSSDAASKLGAEFEKLSQKKAELESRAIFIQGKSFLGPNAQAELDAVVARMDEISPKWEAAEQAAAAYEARINEINAMPPVQPVVPVEEMPPEVEPRALVSKFKAATSSVASFARKAISSVGSVVTKVGSGIKSVAAKAASGIRSMASKISGLTKRSTKDINGMTEAIGKTLNRIKQLLVSALVFNVMRKAFRDFRDYMGAALMKNKEFVTSLGHLKGAMQSAFAPILAYVVPAIATLVSWLATAMSYVARFVQMMSGQVATTNKAGDSTTALSKGMDDLAGSTKAAGDAAKKSLASFDLINQLPDISAGGGGGGAGAAEIPTLEPVKIDTAWIDEFVKKLKSIDVDYEYFFGIGKRVGEWINKGLAAIDWDWIQAWTVSIVTKIAAFLNGAVAGIDWNLVGYTIAQGFNTVLMAAYTWLTTFDWLKWGRSIGDMINGAIYNIQWGKIGDTLAAYFMSAINTLAGAINRVDWVYLGAHLALWVNRFIGGIDWEAMGDLISKGATSALNFIRTAVTEIDWEQIGEDVKKFLTEDIKWQEVWDEFKATVASIFTGFVDFLTGLLGLDSTADTIDVLKIALGGLAGAFALLAVSQLLALGPFALWVLGFAALGAAVVYVTQKWNDWVEAVFGEEAVKAVHDAVDGITTDLEKVRSYSEEKYQDMIKMQEEFSKLGLSDFEFAIQLKHELEQLETDHQAGVDELARQEIEAWNVAPTGEWTFAQMIKAGWEAMIAWFKDSIENSWWRQNVLPWFSLKKWQELGENIKSGISSKWTEFETWWNDTVNNSWWVQNVSGWFTKEKWGEMFENVKAGAQTGLDALNAWRADVVIGFNTLKTDIVTKVSTAWAAIVSVWEGATGWFKRIVTDPIVGLFEAISEKIKNVVNGIIDIANNMIGGINSGINRMINALNTNLRIKIDPVYAFGQMVWSGMDVGPTISPIYLPRIPRLATGAVIPPNKEFAAILGDQKSGMNIEAPETLIRQIVREEISNASGNRTERFTAEATGQLAPLIRLLRIELKREDSREGVSLSNREVIA